MSAPFTPGPWEVSITGGREKAVFKVGDPGGQICKFPGPLFGPSAEEKAANARLIAAAPEMLAALERIVRCAPGDVDMALERCHAAIAKAKGGPDA